MKEDVKFIDEKITELQESADKRKQSKSSKQILHTWLGENNRNEEEEEEEKGK